MNEPVNLAYLIHHYGEAYEVNMRRGRYRTELDALEKDLAKACRSRKRWLRANCRSFTSG